MQMHSVHVHNKCLFKALHDENLVSINVFIWEIMLCFHRLWEDRWCFRENFSSWSRGTENYIHQSAPANQILQ